MFDAVVAFEIWVGRGCVLRPKNIGRRRRGGFVMLLCYCWWRSAAAAGDPLLSLLGPGLWRGWDEWVLLVCGKGVCGVSRG